jgi:hypothetical protein
LSAVIGRTCDPDVVLRDFDIKEAVQRTDLADVDKFILAAKFIKFQIGKEPALNNVPATARMVTDFSSGYVPSFQLAPLHYQCEQWYFIGMMPRHLYADRASDEQFVQEALDHLIKTTKADYQAAEAMAWIREQCK